MILQPLTHSEEDVMQIIWNNGEMYFRDLMNALPEPKPHQNTISTFLKILVDKHYLTTEKQGRIYLYSAAIGFDDYKKYVLKKFIENYFNNSGSELFQILLKEEIITPEDLLTFRESQTIFAEGKSEPENPIKDFVNEITSEKKTNKKDKKKKDKKKKK